MTTQPTRAYQAYAKGDHVTAATPRDAAEAFFVKFPQRRKCNILSGTTDGECFTVRYGLARNGEWPESWKDVTKKTIGDLPS